MTLTDSKLKELLQMRPNSGVQDSATCIDLMKEFIRREFRWAFELGYSRLYPFIDIAGLIIPGIKVPLYIQNKFDHSRFSRSTAESRACDNYLRWLHLHENNSNAISRYNLPDPFESMTEVFRLGGGFSSEHGWLIDVISCGGFDASLIHAEICAETR